MVYIEYQTETEERARVIFQMFKPELLTQERQQSGLLVESIPEIEQGMGTPLLFVNPTTKDLWYEYIPVPKAPLYTSTPEGQLQKQIDDIKLILAEMIGGGAA